MRNTGTIAAAFAVLLFTASSAMGQEPTPEPTPTDPATTPSTEPAPTTTEAPTPAPEGGTEEPEHRFPADQGEAEPTTTGWFRIDTDGLSTQFWVGATHPIGPVAIASDAYVVGSFAEFDIGPAFTFDKLTLTPMVGIGFDFSSQNAASLIAPQLFTIYNADKLYFESWIQFFFNDMFLDGSADTAYTRNFLLYKAFKQLHIGPQVEVTYKMNETIDPDTSMAIDPGVISLPVGGQAAIGYGEKNTLALFLGYDLEAADDSDGIAGRFTFIRNW